MPPEFRPSERSKKKKEPLKPKEPKTIDDIVDDIMKDYRDQQRELGNVDNWGQPKEKLDKRKVEKWVRKNLPKLQGDEGQAKKKGKKRFFPSAPEGLSEAIGSKLKGKSDGQKDKPKIPKVPKIGKPERPTLKTPNASRPRRSNPSSKEKKAPKPRSPSKREPGSKVRIPPLKEKTGSTSDSKKKPISTDTKKPKLSPREKKTPQLKKPSNKESKERLGPKLKMKPPEVRGEKITSKKRLRELTDGEYSALKKKKDFPQRMKEAELHQDLMKKYAGKERIEHGEITKIAKELGVDRETVSNWVTKGMNPRLYTYMNWSIPKSEAAEKVRKLQEANKGIRNLQDVKKRLDNYYLGPEERAAKFHKRELKKMDKYFEFLDTYKEGGLHLEIAKEVGLSDAGSRAYLDGATPRLVELARQIPSEVLREGHKWLPQKYDHGGHGGKWSDWIQVPEKITDYNQVMDVVKQLKPLDNADMRRWEKKYGGDYSHEESFMHMLGTYVSDSGVPSSTTSAISFGMNLSKGYEWSKDFGEASCYNLGKIGIKAHRVSDIAAATSKINTPYGERTISGKEQYQWVSENSPILRWIRKSCLGYNETPKTYQEVDGKWILNAPENLRRSFLQGYSDGDGGVSKTSYYFTISTHSDHDFVEKILGSFGVDTYRSKTYVRTAGIDAVREIEKIPPFMYATDRQEALEKTVKMIDARRTALVSNPPSKAEIDSMNTLRQDGMSYGEIGEKLYDQYGYSLDPRNIWKILQDGQQKKKEKKRA